MDGSDGRFVVLPYWGLLVLVAGCDSRPTAPSATLNFELDAPLCSSILPVEFQVDGIQVGVDTFRVHLPPDHIRSRNFRLEPGHHTLSAAIPHGFTWPDTLVTLEAGESFIRRLPFYCS